MDVFFLEDIFIKLIKIVINVFIKNQKTFILNV